MSISELPVRARPDGLHNLCRDLKGKAIVRDELVGVSMLPAELVDEHLHYGMLLGFIEENDSKISLTQRGVNLAYHEGISGATEPFFLEGLADSDWYSQLISKLAEDERPNGDEILESEVLRVIQVDFDDLDLDEVDLRAGIRTFFMTLEAAGLGEYKLGRSNTEPRIVLRGDITMENIANEDTEDLSRPGTREVADPDEIFHEGFDEQLLARISPQFRYGLYPDAVATAFTVLETRVRDEGGFGVEDYGKDLMTDAFDEEDGPLAMGDLPAEKQGFKMLYMGSYMSLRNPPSHRILDDMDQKQAQDAISMVNFLLTLVENQNNP